MSARKPISVVDGTGPAGETAGPQRPVERAQAEAAVRTLIAWTGDDPTREGLAETPGRVIRAFEEYFSGYRFDPVAELEQTFEEHEGYDEIVVLRDIRFESHCEHHIAPIVGKVHVAYLPRTRVVGISKLARVVDIFARRLHGDGDEPHVGRVPHQSDDAARVPHDDRQPGGAPGGVTGRPSHPAVSFRLLIADC